MTSFVFRETMMGHLCTYGNAYAQIIRNGYGDVAALYPLLPNRMLVGRAENGQLVYAYTTYGDEGISTTAQTHYLREDQVLHIPGLGFDGIMGYSPIAMCRDAVGMGMAAEEFGNKFLNNGARPSGVLSHPGTLKNPDKLREAWMAAYGGTGNAGKVAVLEEGVKYEPISINPSEAQFLETRKFQLNEICRIYRVPPHMIQDLEHATFSNIEHQSLEFVKFTLNPWVARWEQALYKDLLLPAQKENMVIKMNVDGLLRGDYQSRMNGYAIARQNGWMSTNDIRELEDQNPIPDEEGGNLYLINGNMVKLKDAGIYANKGGTAEEDDSKTGSALTTRR
jgi:HK97 family phage portal protein